MLKVNAEERLQLKKSGQVSEMLNKSLLIKPLAEIIRSSDSICSNAIVIAVFLINKFPRYN